MDYMFGLPSTKQGNDCVFVVVDWFSKMAILTACKKIVTMTDTVKLFFERVWVHFGIPQTIIFDRDSRFLSTFWSSLWSVVDTKLTKSTAFHPQTDGQTEVVNQMICASYACTILSIHVHGTRVFHMSEIVTSRLSIVPPAIAHFRWVCDSNPWDPLMLHFLLPLHRQTLPLISVQSTKLPDSLSGFNTSANRSRRFCRNLMLSTSSAMINTGYHSSFRLAIKSSYICRRSVSSGPIESFAHFVMGLTLSPRLWVAMLLSSTLHPSLVCIQYSMWTSFGRIFHCYWTPPRS
jgi:hypothetical protein